MRNPSKREGFFYLILLRYPFVRRLADDFLLLIFMTIQELRDKNLIVLECITGSKAYGLDLPGSDIDLKGVFVLPEKDYYGLNYIAQISNEKNDEMFYELKRFVELLLK